MSEPAIVEREDGFLIGSNFPEREGTKPYQRAAYWIGQTFPEVEDFDRICGSAYSLAAWTEWDGQPRYYLGPWVKEIGYVPEIWMRYGFPAAPLRRFRFRNPGTTRFSGRICGPHGILRSLSGCRNQNGSGMKAESRLSITLRAKD